MYTQEVQTMLTNPDTNIQEDKMGGDNATDEQYYAIIQKFDGDTIVCGAKHTLFKNLDDANNEYLIISKIWDKEVNDELTKTSLNKPWMTSKPVLVKLSSMRL
jgi:hypothetical protein